MRNKSLAIESIAVMIVLIFMAFLVFLVVRSGSSSYNKILTDKQNTESARVAYSYINMKIKQNDSASRISVADTRYGAALRIDSGAYSTYIFFAQGRLYECLTKGDPPEADAANAITKLSGFEVSKKGRYIRIKLSSEKNGVAENLEGTVALRT